MLWYNQGVAFMDFKKEGFSIGRIYLITKDQYIEVRNQENREEKWYGYPKDDFKEPIDYVDEIPVYVTTQAIRGQKSFPSKQYKNIIEMGLVEIGLTHEQAKNYIRNIEYDNIK
jgi:hypothetical protein